MAFRIRLDHAAIAKLLRTQFRVEINALARAIAAAAGPGARVTEYVTDRQAAAVRVPAYRQARDGALTRAAARLGLEVRPSP